MNAQQLKNAILQEAIQGRLVPQNPNDEPASVLLDRIRKEKAKLVKEGKLKKKDLEEKPISEEEIPFEIPESWEWVRWGMLGEYKKGPFGSSLTKSMFVPKSEEAVKVYEQKNAIQKDYTLGDYYISKDKYETMKGFTLHPGDIIISCAGTIGETYLIPQGAPIGIINQALMRAKLFLDSIIPYWLLYFKYILLIENKLKGSGSAIKNIPPFEVLKAMPVPLPPLAEQHRIVSKIEELLPKVEEYGKAQEALDKLNKELPERLKKSILQEAIQGRLVPQDPNDEPASVLLDRIRKEKAKLVKEGKLKKKDLEEKPISEEEIPFEIPESWEWVRLGEISTYAHKKTKINAVKADSNLWGLDLEDIEKGGRLLCKKTVGERKAIGDKTCFVEGDILYSKLRPYLLKILIAPQNGICTPEIIPFTCYGNICKEFIVHLLKSVYVDDYINSSTFGVKMPRVATETMTSLIIPLPPLAEQHRIVSKIEQLFNEIDQLKRDRVVSKKLTEPLTTPKQENSE